MQTEEKKRNYLFKTCADLSLKDRTIKKWLPILDTVKIDYAYWEDVAMFCQNHQDEVTKEGLFSGLHISLKIISKLNLSKVMFTDCKEICKPFKLHYNISRDMLEDIKAQVWNVDIMATLESSVIEQMVIHLNKMIDDEGGIVIGDSFKIEIIDRDSVSKLLEMTGYILPYNVYRYKKLKKVKRIINGQGSSLC